MTTTDLSPMPVTDAGLAILDAMRARRSVGKMTTDVPDPELVRQMIDAARWAPNHHQTEPWRFVVLEGDARLALGKVMGDVAAGRETDQARAEVAASNAARKPLRSPYVIAVGVEPSPDPTVPELEEIAATSAAAQNMLLAAHALGLAAIWRSGWIAFEPPVRDFLGLSERGKVLGFIYVGFPAMEPSARTRRSVEEISSWRSV